ncbi:MAG: hypothetical protein IJS61_08665 [Firmicutes bacterium]|nr:hypothetical protein [Bacillota bacterium]
MRRIILILLSTLALSCTVQAKTPFEQIDNAVSKHQSYVAFTDKQLSCLELSQVLSAYFASNINSSFIERTFNAHDEDNNGLFDGIDIQYKYDISENKRIIEFINSKENELISKVLNMPQREQVSYIYRYFCRKFKYDEELHSDIYYLYKYNKGICCSFSYAFKRLMDKLDIPCRLELNNGRTHQWNSIFIDGKWQKIDITDGIRLYETGFPNAEMRAFLK